MKIADVIKYEGEHGTLVWKSPAEDFNTMSQLIVHESQNAVLFKDGQALDLFGAGRHTLKTANIPLLGKLVNLPFDGVSPFHCEIYYINRVVSLDVLWGTREPIDVIDPQFQLPLKIGASGSLGIRVSEPRKLLLKIVGTEACLGTNQFVSYFKNLVSMKVKRHIAELIRTFGYFAAAEHLEELSDSVKQCLSEDLNEYGVELVNFYVSTVGVGEKDLDALKRVRERKLEYNELGYNWADERIAEVTLAYASNPGSANNIAGMAAQMPLAFTFGNMIAKRSAPMLEEIGAGFSQQPRVFTSDKQEKSEATSPTGSTNGKWRPPFTRKDTSMRDENLSTRDSATPNVEKRCTQCGRELSDGVRFCPHCGTKQQSSCPQCGKSVEEEAFFCSSCGMKVR